MEGWSAQARAHAVAVFPCPLEKACVPVCTQLVRVLEGEGVVVEAAGVEWSTTCIGRRGGAAVATECERVRAICLARESSDV